MKASLVLIALSMVICMNLATATSCACPSGQTLTCLKGERIGRLCYGECPQGYFATDSDATPVGAEVDGYYPGPATYCWQECHGNAYQTYYTTTCGNYSPYGDLSTTPDYAFADPDDRYYNDEASCVADYPQGCEICDGTWNPINNCGQPSCSKFCPVQCPSDMKQLDAFTCQKNSMKRSVIGKAKCAPSSRRL